MARNRKPRKAYRPRPVLLDALTRLQAAEIATLKKLLQEALEISDNWPGIAYTADLIQRCKKAMPGWALTYE